MGPHSAEFQAACRIFLAPLYGTIWAFAQSPLVVINERMQLGRHIPPKFCPPAWIIGDVASSVYRYQEIESGVGIVINLKHIAVLAVILGLAGCGVSQTSDLSVTGAWVRPVAGTGSSMAQSTPQAGMSDAMTQTASATGAQMDGPVTAAYMTIVNKGGQADKLIAVTSSAAGVSEVHETKDMGGGMLGMQPVQGGLEIPANGSVSLKPGGYHIMMMNIHQDLKVGQTITMNLRFQSGKQITLDVPVKEQP